MKKIVLSAAGIFLFVHGAFLNAADPSNGYHLISKIPIAGDGGWDCLSVDSVARRLYVSHGDQVEVVDIDSAVVVGKIPDLSGVHAIAIAPELNRGFISNGKSSTVTMFDLKTLAKLGEIQAGKNPDAILYDPATRYVFAFNGKSADATVIDAVKGAAISTIELGGKPEFAVADEKGHVYVNLEDKNSVLKINSKKLNIEKSWALAPGEKPSGLAIDKKNQKLFCGCGNHLMVVVNIENGRVIGSLPIGDRVDATVFDPVRGLIFNSNGDGTLTVIRQESGNKYSVLENLKTQTGARTMALDPKTHEIFLSVADLGPRPEPTKENPRPRPDIIPGTFNVLVFGK